MDVLTVLVSLGGAALSAGGASSIVGAVTRRRSDRAEVTTRLTDAAMTQVDQLQERVHEAELAAREARNEAEDTRQQMRAVRREAADLAERMAMLARWIHDPNTTMDVLRARVPLAPTQNGAG